MADMSLKQRVELYNAIVEFGKRWHYAHLAYGTPEYDALLTDEVDQGFKIMKMIEAL